MKDKKLCTTPRCKNKKAPKRTICWKCKARLYKKRNLARAVFRDLRHNAKRRNKPFTITFEDFLKFCYQYNYLQGKGKTKTSLTIDCIINELGYVPGNLQALTNEENGRKGVKVLVYDWQTRQAKVI